jgi:L-asparaginase/Glu-tRNA(Gln) amidotransferase subunit D
MPTNCVGQKQFALSVLALVLLLGTVAIDGQAAKPKIAVFSGPNATIQHGLELLTSNKAREKHGLPLLADRDGRPLRFDSLRPQRLAAPVTVYIEAYTAHPLERDMSELYAAPDGYVSQQTGAFNTQRQSPNDIPVYVATLHPSDGLYMLPYMARQVDGKPWEQDCAFGDAPLDKCRTIFYPDASRPFEEIDRFHENALSSKAEFDFYRVVPSAGFRKGLPASQRTDIGEGDIPPEVWGEDFFPYGTRAQRHEPPRVSLPRIANMVQKALGSGKYAGGIWLEGSPTTEETTYWLNLLVDTRLPIVGNSSQTAHGTISNDGDGNVVDSVNYILSGVWKDMSGADKIGAVMIQEKRVITAREVQKVDARPGGYVPTGGHGGVVATVRGRPEVTFVPTRRHTYSSEVNLTKLGSATQGVRRVGNRISNIQVPVKDSRGELLAAAVPNVTIVQYAAYNADDVIDDPLTQVEISARIDKNLADFPLSGFVVEGNAPFANINEPLRLALERAVVRGMPVVRVGRGNIEGFTTPSEFFIGGSNLTSTKARLLLMAAILKVGSLPVPTDPDRPTATEMRAIRSKMAQYQEIFDTH